MRIARPVLCLVSLVALVLPAQAQWKWKDGQGQVHLSDTPPPREVQDKDILQDPCEAELAYLHGGSDSFLVALYGVLFAREILPQHFFGVV